MPWVGLGRQWTMAWEESGHSPTSMYPVTCQLCVSVSAHCPLCAEGSSHPDPSSSLKIRKKLLEEIRCQENAENAEGRAVLCLAQFQTQEQTHL